jgi:hypothetical protein
MRGNTEANKTAVSPPTNVRLKEVVLPGSEIVESDFALPG